MPGIASLATTIVIVFPPGPSGEKPIGIRVQQVARRDAKEERLIGGSAIVDLAFRGLAMESRSPTRAPLALGLSILMKRRKPKPGGT